MSIAILGIKIGMTRLCDSRESRAKCGDSK